MKKNILAVIILAATLVNLTLTAMIVFTFIPYVTRANNLVVRIVQALDLDLESPEAKEEAAGYNIEDTESKAVFSGERANLQVGADGKSTHYAEVTASLLINKEHDDYKDKNPLIDTNINQIEDFILTEINKYSNDTLLENKENVEKAVLEKLQNYFESTFIVKVTIKMLVL